MKFLGENPFYTLLLLTEKPGKWPRWSLAPLPLALAALAGLAWASAAGPAWGWATAGLLLVMALADWALLSFLPRSGSSFGPVQPPFLALSALRGLLAVAAALLARWGAALPWALHGTVQLAIWFLAAYGTLVEPFLLQVTRLQIVTPRLANPGGPLRVVQLSDLHVERLTRRDRALPDTVAGLDADVMVLTGDYLNTTYNQDPQALADLEELLAQLEAPGQRYGIWGSPEVDCTHLLRPIIQAAGITLLEDCGVELHTDRYHLWIMGITCSHDRPGDAERLRRLVAEAPPGALTLLLYHTPDLMPEAAALGVDLYLAGHTHGGQWRLPGFGAVVTSSRYGKRYEAGHYREGNTHLYVSRGLGMEGFGTPRARFFCRPELVVVDLAGRAGEDPTPRSQARPGA